MASTALPASPLTLQATLRWSVVERMVNRLDPTTILEIGCGMGAAGARLAEKAEYTGLEPDPTSFAIARERITARGGSVLNGFTSQYDLPQADLVCAFEVLEHIEDDSGALAEWIGLVRPGGHLLLSVPAHPARFGPSDVRAGHFRRYAPTALAALLRSTGFVDIAHRLYGFPLGYALEAVRNVNDRRFLERSERTVAENTAASGRTRQPTTRALGVAIDVATAPFRFLQDLTPAHGTGLVIVAAKPVT